MSVFEPSFKITNSMTEDLSRIDQARGFLEATKLSEEWIGQMERQAVVREAHYSTHIEGAQLTLEQSERLLAGEKLLDVDPDDERELRNWVDAFEFVKQYTVGRAPITERMILEIHRRLVEGVRGGAASPGTYREKQNYIVDGTTKEVVYTPPPAFDVPVLMLELIQWLNDMDNIHPVIKSGISQFQLVHIHPFRDGNGRTSRLLSTLCLYRDGYDFKRLFAISEFYDRDRQKFYDAIQGVRDSNMDLTGWLEYFTRGLSTQLIEVKERGEQVIRRDLLVQKYRLNGRQEKALGFLLQNSALTIQDFERMCPNVNRRSLQRDLKEMLDKELVASEGATNQLVYILRV